MTKQGKASGFSTMIFQVLTRIGAPLHAYFGFFTDFLIPRAIFIAMLCAFYFNHQYRIIIVASSVLVLVELEKCLLRIFAKKKRQSGLI